MIELWRDKGYTTLDGWQVYVPFPSPHIRVFRAYINGRVVDEIQIPKMLTGRFKSMKRIQLDQESSVTFEEVTRK